MRDTFLPCRGPIRLVTPPIGAQAPVTMRSKLNQLAAAHGTTFLPQYRGSRKWPLIPRVNPEYSHYRLAAGLLHE